MSVHFRWLLLGAVTSLLAVTQTNAQEASCSPNADIAEVAKQRGAREICYRNEWTVVAVGMGPMDRLLVEMGESATAEEQALEEADVQAKSVLRDFVKSSDIQETRVYQNLYNSTVAGKMEGAIGGDGSGTASRETKVEKGRAKQIVQTIITKSLTGVENVCEIMQKDRAVICVGISERTILRAKAIRDKEARAVRTGEGCVENCLDNSGSSAVPENSSAKGTSSGFFRKEPIETYQSYGPGFRK